MQTNIPKHDKNQYSWDPRAVLTDFAKFPHSLLLQPPEAGTYQKSEITTKLKFKNDLHFPVHY